MTFGRRIGWHFMPPATFSMAGRQYEARKYTAKDWDTQRPEIIRLYKNGTLESVMKFMREQHRLAAIFLVYISE
jgi:hypothetical protein